MNLSIPSVHRYEKLLSLPHAILIIQICIPSINHTIPNIDGQKITRYLKFVEIHPSQCKQDDNLQTDPRNVDILRRGFDSRNHFAPVFRLEVEEVYDAQPDGFVDPDHSEKVYRLRKALYGCKVQAPRALYDESPQFLDVLSIGIPMATKPKLDADLSGKLVDQTDHRSKIGSLMYLTSSRPNICKQYVLCKVISSQLDVQKKQDKHCNDITAKRSTNDDVAASFQQSLIHYHMLMLKLQRHTISIKIQESRKSQELKNRKTHANSDVQYIPKRISSLSREIVSKLQDDAKSKTMTKRSRLKFHKSNNKKEQAYNMIKTKIHELNDKAISRSSRKQDSRYRLRNSKTTH
ncbi:retrovirus-related pol polyprotein from transposon TNT 1-94 [Tanacetum coccineum]